MTSYRSSEDGAPGLPRIRFTARLASFFAPEAIEGLLVVARPGIGAADKLVSICWQRGYTIK
jgi:hypothetical protein